ncbi:MAG: ABC transporter substrate-binding protein [Gammaproteobacteria bacterium]
MDALGTVVAIVRRHRLHVGIALFVGVFAAVFYVAVVFDGNSVVAPQRLSIAAVVYPGSTTIHVAQDRGYFEAEGLHVTIHQFASGRACLNAVRSGKADVATVAEIPIALAAMQKEPIAVIATIFSGQKDHAVIARRDHGITQPTHLKGKRVGFVPGTTSAFLMDMVLGSAGLSRADVRSVELAADAIVPALLSGEVDAVSTWHPLLQQLQKELGLRGLTFDAFDVQGLFSLTVNVVVKREFLAANPEPTRRLLRALARAADFVERNPQEAQRTTARYSPLSEALLRELWGGYRFDIRLDQSLQIALEDVSRWAIRHRLAESSEVPDFRAFIAADALRQVKPEAISVIR